jgi:hypothetical protein
MKRVMLLAGLGAMMAAAVGCAPSRLDGRTFNDKSLDKHVLIAAWNTEFKRQVLAKVQKALKKEAAYIEIIDPRDLDERDPGSYDVIVILDQVWMWRLSRTYRSFLEDVEKRGSVILVPTAGDPDWRPVDKGVDVITATSEPKNIDRVANEIIERVQYRLSPQYRLLQR